MSDGQEKREFLEGWQKNPDARSLAEAYPDCGCESACPVDGGFGVVQDNEMLRYFVLSRSDQDLKRPKKKKFSSAIFARAFLKGMSTLRISYNSPSDTLATAKILYEDRVRASGEYGGVFGVADFPAGAMRRNHADGTRIACVLDTPIVPDRMSHADVVYSDAEIEPELVSALKRVLFNQIGGLKAIKLVSDLEDCDLTGFLPEVLKE